MYDLHNGHGSRPVSVLPSAVGELCDQPAFAMPGAEGLLQKQQTRNEKIDTTQQYTG